MSQELRKVFETFLKDFKKTYNDKILSILSDLSYSINVSTSFKRHTLFCNGYIKALKDVERIVKRFK